MDKRTDLLKDRKVSGTGLGTGSVANPGAGSGTSDLVIVSAFGRGNWLATELAGRGWKVSLVDVSEKLGEGEPEDAEGPFGLFDSPDLLPSQKNFFSDAQVLRSGFTVWLPEGPLECRSELTEFQLKARGLAPMLESYLRRPLSARREAGRERGSLRKQDYKSVWLAHLAHQVTSPLMNENQIALNSGEPAPLFSTFAIRHGERTGWKNGLRACEEKGVKVFASAGLNSVRMHGRGLDTVEILDSVPNNQINNQLSGQLSGQSNTQSRTIGARTFVWMLSSAETEQLSPAVSRHLYPQGPISEDWFWARYQVELGGKVFDEQIPAHVALISDLFLPWTHANLLILRKRARSTTATRSKTAIDVWLRLPTFARGELNYFTKIKSEIERALAAKIPFAEPHVVKVPLQTTGPVRFPIFEQATLGKLKTLRAPNLFFCTVEQSGSQDWLGYFRMQNQAVARLEKLKAQWVAAANRQAQKAEKRARRAAQ
jgi:hypothetical protein